MTPKAECGSGNRYYKILNFVSVGGHGATKKDLYEKYGERDVDELIACEDIVKVPGSDPNNPIYKITNKGRKRMWE